MSTTNEEEFNNDLKNGTSKRIASIDFVKGFALVWIILAHAGLSWLDYDWIYIYGLAFAFLDVFGPSLFVFLSALSVIFSFKSKQGKLPEKIIRNRIFVRGFLIMAIGIIGNLLNSISELMTGEEKKRYEVALEKVKNTKQTNEKIKLVKDLLPSILIPEGFNPLKTIFNMLSDIHFFCNNF